MDWYENYKKNKIQMILKNGESIHEINSLFCPYCGFENVDLCDLDLKPNDEREETYCEKCGEEFFYKINLAFSTTKKKE